MGNASLAPGLSPGVLTIEGNLALSSGSTLLMELGGTDPSFYDRLSATGSLQLGGQLVISSLNGFQPTASQTFELLRTQALVSGSMNSVTTAGDNLGALQLRSLVLTTSAGSTPIPTLSSTLFTPYIEAQIVNLLNPAVNNFMGATSSNTSSLTSFPNAFSLNPGMTSGGSQSLVPPPYTAAPPAAAPASASSLSSASPNPAVGTTPGSTSPSAAPEVSSVPAVGASITQPLQTAPTPAPITTFVRTAFVRSLELDGTTVPPASVTSRKETAEVSYASPKSDADKGKGC
jgi:hypothetical protein